MIKIVVLQCNLKEEVLIVYSNDGLCRAYALNDYFDNSSFFEVFVSSKSYFNKNFIQLGCYDIEKLSQGDVLLFRPNGILTKIFDVKSNDNLFFVTGQCDNRCLMCSQPPSNKNDINYFYKINSMLVNFLPSSIDRIGISGGEPSFDKIKLLSLLNLISLRLPNVSLHLLSNGRSFKDVDFVESLSFIKLHDLLIGVPLHSDFYRDHDFISAVSNSYNETLKGIYNLARFNIKVEIRVVINKLNYSRLYKLAEFIYHNFPFAEHIAFMSLEYTGLVLRNKDLVWIDPYDYKDELEKAVLYLDSWGLNVSIYNFPLCLVKESLYKFSAKSISDWKVMYFEECNKCQLKESCGGDFSTSNVHSSKIKAILDRNEMVDL